MRDTTVAFEVADQHLPSPEHAVVAVAEPVHAHADHAALDAGLHQRRGHMGVMVLYGHLLAR